MVILVLVSCQTEKHGHLWSSLVLVSGQAEKHGHLWSWFLVKLRSMDICGHLTSWFQSQGSILGPIIFLVYIIDLPLYAKNSNLFLFADDAKYVKLVKKYSNCLCL